MKIQVSELEATVVAGVEKLGYTGEEARIIADVLLYAQLRGNNQGISKIATGGVPKADAVAPFRVVTETKCGALLSGGHSMVASVRAADKAVDLARTHGVGVVASNNTRTSSGSIGYFARRIADAGYIALVTVANGGWAAVAPFGSAEPKLGTNPLAYAFPYDGGAVVFDTATAAAAYYGVVEAMLKGEPLPEGVGLNALGEPTTNAAEVLGTGDGEAVGGALTTFAGHKGFGLSLLVQLLGSAFALAGFPGGHEEDGAGTFVLAIDPGLLAGTDEYLTRSRELIDSIRSAKPIAGQRVSLPGERGDAIAAEAERTGEIEIADAIWNELVRFVS
ncbi:Ldh family oxidoreductase [Leucobacter rhizosphaerae]|uniref:Ldh family oxidoreductase n=1 Tax=Leucobacter rhizosphaerae TaxID=2932245 RepID=A0ABY4FSN0_9MICO|nr:Ldh family oxidoreductase [Leucobacter rhizosphaerae]UOQ59313.1 Ldh family oxidoreductase [Leucobacter rhizosphaerae]